MEIQGIYKEYLIIDIYNDQFAIDFSKTTNEKIIEANRTIYEPILEEY